MTHFLTPSFLDKAVECLEKIETKMVASATIRK